ncbi:MAG: signal peptide peptidase SppA [Planctomycetota bacterium]|nr:MAG: signal peptide peptidase SppA [Planctomycetota bacterium]REK18492.1 MAG: signal peptide peptidase SppA [Planctomycetota bacterium]REK39448.1 MAG: signal peptide peptidase SppA [Planctomycetota bacterium]
MLANPFFRLPLSLLLFLLLFVSLGGLLRAEEEAAKDAADAKPAANKRVKLASISIAGAFPETTQQVGLFGEMEQNLRETIKRIGQAAEDDDIQGLVLRIRSPLIGRAKVEELCAAVRRAQAKGMKVYADITGAQGADYLIASACDEIVMPPSGSLILAGVRAEVMFYRGLMDKVGVRADFIQVGRFKGAAEPFVRSEMSDELRAQFESLIGDYYDQMIERIAEARDLEADRVRELIDEGMFSAAKAKEVGLIDHVMYEDELRERLRTENDAEKLAVVRNYGKKDVQTDFSGFGGMVQLMQLMMGVEPTRSRSRGDRIAIIYAVGPIMDGASEQGLFGNATLGGDTIVKALRMAAKHKRVKAIVLRVDSPGGSALASDLIWREVARIDKPVVASMGDTAASGGYYISMAADKIYAAPGTLTGSIGVVGGKLALSGLYDKVGLSVDVIARGKNSGAFSSTQVFSETERAAMKQMMLDIYEQFTSKAAEGRNMELEQLKSLAEGRVFTGRQAKENGLVDELGTLRDAIVGAKELAGIDKDTQVDLWVLPKPQSFFETLFEGESIETSAKLSTQLREVLPEVTEPLAASAWLRQLFEQRAATILPYRIEIK